MISRKLFLIFGFFYVLNLSNTLKAQSEIGIVLNEFSATNVNGFPGSSTDIYGRTSDWVEIYCNYEYSVSLASYYLSNDKNNKFKWQFPSDFILGAKSYGLVWLSGKSGPKGVMKSGETHANFTLDQCKGQYLMLSTEEGVIRDSIYIMKAKAGHTWGRNEDEPKTEKGIAGWKLFTQASPKQLNPMVFSYPGYAPTPKCFLSTVSNFKGPNTGGFTNDGPQIAYFRLSDLGPAYDTANSCYWIYYTLNGEYPDTTDANTIFYPDSANGFFTLDATTMVRAIAIAKPNNEGCQKGYLPSFCETNTYFIDAEYSEFDPNFGVLSVALDTTWFNNPGSTIATTVHVEYYDKKKQVSEGYGVINKPVNELWSTKQRGFYVTIDDERGFGCNFEGNIFNVEGLGTTTRTVFPTLHASGGDFESHSVPAGAGAGISFGTGIRDVFYQSLAAKYNLNVNPLHIKPAVAFMNGAYIGVYSLKEIYDKYYEAYYNKQSRDSLDLNFMHGAESAVIDHEGAPSTFGANFRSEVYDPVMTLPMNSKTNYDKVMAKFDKASFIDYIILNSYAMNGDMFNYNVAFAKGSDPTKKGGKWHYYLWNTPAIFNFTAVPGNTTPLAGTGLSPCYFFTRPYITPLQQAFNGHGNIFKKLMTTVDNSGQACGKFQLEFRNRFQDLMNGALNCQNIAKHYEFVKNLYLKEYKFHEDPGSPPKPGLFPTTVDLWDTLATKLGYTIANRCYVVENFFKTPGCFGATGPYNITVNVKPEGAGSVKLNSTVLDKYIWTGKYYATLLSFKAIPTNTNYVFHHWEFEKHTPTLPLSMDSVAVHLAAPENVIAVFTDKSNDITSEGEGANLPTAFTPNGDGTNDDFRPLGSGEFVNDYQMTIWNRWGQEVFRSVSPQTGWDGNYRGQQAITGVYAYIITYRNVFGESKLLKGNVTLTR
jgi:gliding motility-associated-like protein